MVVFISQNDMFECALLCAQPHFLISIEDILQECKHRHEQNIKIAQSKTVAQFPTGAHCNSYSSAQIIKTNQTLVIDLIE